MKGLLLVPLALAALLAGGATRIVQDQCGPFTDVSPAFCPYILELYYLGITAGTSATTFSPDDPLTRAQGAVFVAKGLNQSLARSSRRAALGQWWTTPPHPELGLGVTTVDSIPVDLISDGADVWTANVGGQSVSRVRASDGRLLGTWTGVSSPWALLVAMGRVFVAGSTGDDSGFGGTLYVIDPTQPPGPATVVTNSLWAYPQGLAFDGTNIWVVSRGPVFPKGGALSIVYPGPTYPWSFTTIRDHVALPNGGIVFDGQSIWFTDLDLKRMSLAGEFLQSVALGQSGQFPIFDGKNIWVTTSQSAVVVVSASEGAVVKTLSGNGLAITVHAGFDGERVLVTNLGSGTGGSVSLWRAASLEPLGSFPISDPDTPPYGVCSDGVNFWISLYSDPGKVVRF